MTPAQKRILLFGYLPQTQAILNAMSPAPTPTEARDINTFVYTLVQTGLWDLIDGLWVLVAHAAQPARINWKNPTQVATAVNSPTFTVNAGYTFDGATNYLDTGLNVSTGVAQMTNASISIGVYERVNLGTSTGLATGVSTGSPNRITVRPRSASNFATGAATSSLTNGAVTVTDSRGLTAFDRNNLTFTIYKNGAALEAVSPSNTTGSRPNLNLWIGGENLSGSLNAARPCTLGLVFAGATMPLAQQAAMYAGTQAYMTARGANV